MKYYVCFPWLCLYMCDFTWASHFPCGALSFGEGKRSIGLFSLPTLICTGRQAGATPRWHGDIQPLRAARLSDVSISVSACPHFSLRECKNFRLSVSSSSVCIPLLYLGFDHTLPSLFSAACYLITCRPFPFTYAPTTGSTLLLSSPSTQLSSNAVWSTLLVGHGDYSQLCSLCLSPDRKIILPTRNLQRWTKWLQIWKIRSLFIL